MNKTIIFGAGGFGTEVAMLIYDINKSDTNIKFDLIGFIDDNSSFRVKN